MKRRKTPSHIIAALLIHNPKISKVLPDKLYLKILYRGYVGKKLNLKDPKTYNEKLQWLKLYDRKDIYTTMVDKYEVKKYVASLIGKQYIIPTLGVWNSFDEIDFEKLPNQFVLKCTHDSGGIVICKDKKNFKIEEAKKVIEKSLKNEYFWNGREWPYKNVSPRIIAEKYMEDNKYASMRDYKFFCFNSEPKIMYLSEGLENHKTASMSFYDMDFNATNCKRSDYRTLDYKPDKPKNWELMKKFSSILSNGIPHARIDWYEINGKLFFGEITFFTCSGMVPFEENKWDIKLGKWIKLPTDKL